MSIQPNIGLDATARQSVVEILNLLLADEAVLSYKTHRAVEQVASNDAHDLHLLFDAQIKQIDEVGIEIAERVKILGGSPISAPTELMNSARLDAKLVLVPGVVSLVADQEALIRFLREDAQKCSEMYEDQGSFVLLVSVMQKHEKMAWHLRSNMNLEQFNHEK